MFLTSDGSAPKRAVKQLVKYGCAVDEFPFATGLVAALAARNLPALLLVEVLAGADAEVLALVRRVRRRHPRLPIVLLVDQSSEELAIGALKAGVTEYFSTATPVDELARSIASLLGLGGDPKPETRVCEKTRPAAELVGGSQSMRAILDTVKMIAPTDTTVLITGETGTGKELVARLIHQRSPRRSRPFLCVNCAAVPESLLESEFFGYERGAFTGAVARHPGAFEIADGGTLVLDEVGDMTPQAQVKILRAIEDGHINRLGGNQEIPVDLRLIACTHQDLERLVEEGKFREDLYYRLHVVRIHVPPLRDRKEDLPALLEYCLQRARRRLGLQTRGFTRDAIGYLIRHDWPGNVRELQNFIESVVATRQRPEISLEDLPEVFRTRLEQPAALPQDDKERLLAALVAAGWNKSEAAHRLGCSRMTIYRKLEKYGIAGSGNGSATV